MASGARPRFERLLDAFEHSGYRIVDLATGQPFEVVLDDLKLKRTLPLRVYLWSLGHERFRPNTRRVAMTREEPGPLHPREASAREAAARTLVLGYATDLDAYVAWQPEAHPKPAQGSSIRVGEETLGEAIDRGVGIQVHRPLGPRQSAEIVTAFRPDRLRDYLDAAPDLSRARSALEGSPESFAVSDAEEVALGALQEREPEAAPAGVPPSFQVELDAEPGLMQEAESDRPAAEREVSTGFAGREDGAALEGSHSLRPGERYLFWIEIGAPVEHSIETTRTDIPLELLPEQATLVVALFGFDDELSLEAGSDLGRLDVAKDGTVAVAEPVARPAVEGETLEKRLYFPVRAPADEGVARLRCSIYCEGVLVQSRLVSATVASNGAGRLASELDYTLSHSLHPGQLSGLPEADLSLMLNGEDGCHQLRVFGPGDGDKDAFKAEASFGDTEISELVDYCRGELRTVSWGNEDEWAEGLPSFYESPPTPEQFKDDLTRLAVRGAMTYETLVDRLAGGRDKRSRLEAKTMRLQARVEIAATPKQFVPAAMFYDAPIDDGLELGDYELCPDFLAAREGPAPLDECQCFSGGCRSWGKEAVVCPGGFWGFRHSIGWPASSRAGDTAGVIAHNSKVRTGIAYTDSLHEVQKHREDIEDLLGKLDEAKDRTQLLALLRKRRNEIVYLYCHGGVTQGRAPFLTVGASGSSLLTMNSLYKLKLRDGASLVFLNGCRTAAVSPRQQFDLVSAFIEHAGALGVIGTEITVFEPMAGPFGLAFLDRFICGRATVGEAIRSARLATLKGGNPLGLAYVPFVLGGTALA